MRSQLVEGRVPLKFKMRPATSVAVKSLMTWTFMTKLLKSSTDMFALDGDKSMTASRTVWRALFSRP